MLFRSDNRFHQAVHDGFLKLAQANPGRIHLIDAMKSVEEVTSDMMGVLKKVIV